MLLVSFPMATRRTPLQKKQVLLLSCHLLFHPSTPHSRYLHRPSSTRRSPSSPFPNSLVLAQNRFHHPVMPLTLVLIPANLLVTPFLPLLPSLYFHLTISRPLPNHSSLAIPLTLPYSPAVAPTHIRSLTMNFPQLWSMTIRMRYSL